MKFIQTFKQSFYSPEFYRELKNKKFWFSLKYFYSLVAILAFVYAIVISVSALPAIKGFMGKIEPYLRSYPAELVITIQDGKASTNVSEPYFIKMPDGLCDLESQEAGFCELNSLIVIDTKTPFSSAKMEEYKSLAWLTEDSLIVKQDKETKLTSLKDVPNTVINKQFMDGLADKAGSIVRKAIPVVLPLAAVLIFFGLIIYLSKLIFLLFGALIVWIIGRIKKVDMTYGYAYRIGLHAITLGVILRFLELFGLPNVPLLLTALFAVCAWVNIAPEKAVAETVPVSPSPAEEKPVE